MTALPQLDAETRIRVLIKNAVRPDDLAAQGGEIAALCDESPALKAWARALYRERMAQMNQSRAKWIEESGRDFG